MESSRDFTGTVFRMHDVVYLTSGYYIEKDRKGNGKGLDRGGDGQPYAVVKDCDGSTDEIEIKIQTQVRAKAAKVLKVDRKDIADHVPNHQKPTVDALKLQVSPHETPKKNRYENSSSGSYSSPSPTRSSGEAGMSAISDSSKSRTLFMPLKDSSHRQPVFDRDQSLTLSISSTESLDGLKFVGHEISSANLSSHRKRSNSGSSAYDDEEELGLYVENAESGEEKEQKDSNNSNDSTKYENELIYQNSEYERYQANSSLEICESAKNYDPYPFPWVSKRKAKKPRPSCLMR